MSEASKIPDQLGKDMAKQVEAKSKTLQAEHG